MTVRLWLVVLVALPACKGSFVQNSPRTAILSGVFVGLEEGTDVGVPFQDISIQFTLSESGDSVTGTWEGLGVGIFRGEIDRTMGTNVTFTMDQSAPCAGTFTGTAEARVGTTFSGDQTVGISGTYAGTHCNGDIASTFFVQLSN